MGGRPAFDRHLLGRKRLAILVHPNAATRIHEVVREAQAQALPLLNEFKSWLDKLAPGGIRYTPLAAAVAYAPNQWDAIVRECDQGWLLIDNTRSERALHPIAIERSNWPFFGGDAGGRTAACYRLAFEPLDFPELDFGLGFGPNRRSRVSPCAITARAAAASCWD